MMFGSNQSQQSGDNSQLLQAGTIIINNGIDEKRAREIVDEKVQTVIRDFSQEAKEVAETRIQAFEDDLIPKLVRNNILESLRDPSIQILICDAQRSAASTERTADYSLLSELLINRVKKGDDRNIRAGISHAVRIVDEISDEALLGLTVFYIVSNYLPFLGTINIRDGIKYVSSWYSKFMYDELPKGVQWLENLEILGAVHLNQWGNLKRFENYFNEILTGYTDVGIKIDSDKYIEALDIIVKAGLPIDLLCEHELRPGYVRVSVSHRRKISTIPIFRWIVFQENGSTKRKPIQESVNEDQINALQKVYDLYDKDERLRNENVQRFVKLCEEDEILSKICKWWNAISGNLSLTLVGRILGCANAQRFDARVPELPEIFNR